MTTVYLVCGVAGSGKSWVCNQLLHLIHYTSYDQDGIIEPSLSLELHDRTVHISTTIENWRSKGINVIPIFIMGDFLQIKQQIINRGGKITPGLYRRWKRMQSLSIKYSIFTDNSTEVLKYLKDKLRGNNSTNRVINCVYKAIFSNKKVYIGQAQEFLPRLNHHRWRAYANRPESNSLFYNAWRKYGEPSFSILEQDVPKDKLSEREIFWINHYNSNIDGYNLTEGGEGCKGRIVSEETRKKIGLSNRGRKYNKPNTSEKIEARRQKCIENGKKHRITEDGKRRISEKNSGKVQSERTKRQKIIPISKPVIRSDGKTYLNMADAAKDIGCRTQQIYRVISGKFKTYKTFGFQYITDITLIEDIKKRALEELNILYPVTENNIT